MSCHQHHPLAGLYVVVARGRSRVAKGKNCTLTLIWLVVIVLLVHVIQCFACCENPVAAEVTDDHKVWVYEV
jgi:hypothetical protein